MQPTLTRRDLRLASGLVLFTYIATHLINHALGLISLAAAEDGLLLAVTVWHTWPGTIVLYGAAAIHIALALWTIYERRTFRLPPAELLRIGLGLWLPVLLIGHAITTRLEYELTGAIPDYARITGGLWASNAEWRQIGLLAPGWLHGCLGLYFVFGRKPLFQRLQYILFAIALLLPVLSALGFVAMGRELARSAAAPAVAATASPSRDTLNRWREGLLWGYGGIVGLAFAARALRNLTERRRGLIAISFPSRRVRVPHGWSVLDASRSFHLAHTSRCGGRGRCSTCRVRVTAGAQFCPQPGEDERATLQRIRAEPDVRLACQLRPTGDISLVPLVRTDRPVYRIGAPALESEREIVVLVCDFLNREALARDHLSQDVMFAFTRYAQAACSAVRACGGTVSYVDPNSVCALFGTAGDPRRAARQSLAAAAAIDRALGDLNGLLGQQWACKADVSICIHAGSAALSDIGQGIELIMAAGEAIDVAADMRRAAAKAGARFAISQAVFTYADVDPPATTAIALTPSHGVATTKAYLFDALPSSAALGQSSDAGWRRAWTRAAEFIRG